MPQISLDWDTVKAAYPMRPLTGALQTFMDQTPGTPCCVQMCNALSVAGAYIGPRSNRRRNSSITTTAGTHYYVLAVDEMKWFLEQNFGMGDEISKDDNGGRRGLQAMMSVLSGRTGILVFSEPPYGKHTELWDLSHMHQTDISPAVFNASKVLFWDVMVTAAA